MAKMLAGYDAPHSLWSSVALWFSWGGGAATSASSSAQSQASIYGQAAASMGAAGIANVGGKSATSAPASAPAATHSPSTSNFTGGTANATPGLGTGPSTIGHVAPSQSPGYSPPSSNFTGGTANATPSLGTGLFSASGISNAPSPGYSAPSQASIYGQAANSMTAAGIGNLAGAGGANAYSPMAHALATYGPAASSMGQVGLANVGGTKNVTEISQTNMANYRDAIAAIESRGRGNYSAIGRAHPTLGRPIGRYQVMEYNIPKWTREAIGRTVSTQEFLNNPKIQDAVFDHHFGQYLTKFGTPERAAQAWIAGPNWSGRTNPADALGTRVSDYASKFSKELSAIQSKGRSDPAEGMLARAADVGPIPSRSQADADRFAATYLGGQERGKGMAALVPSNYPETTGRLGTVSDGLEGPAASKLSAGALGILNGLAQRGYGNLGVNSGHRSQSQNVAARGARNSQHLDGNAIDLATRDLTPEQRAEVAQIAAEAGAKGIGVYPSGNMHFDARPGSAAFWGPSGFRGSDISAFPAEIQPTLNQVAQASPFAVMPSQMQAPPSRETAMASTSPTANPLEGRVNTQPSLVALDQVPYDPSQGAVPPAQVAEQGRVQVSPTISAPVDRQGGVHLAVAEPTQEQGLSTGQRIAAGAIDIGTSLIPGIGMGVGLLNAGSQLATGKTIGQHIVGGFGSGGAASGINYAESMQGEGGPDWTQEIRVKDQDTSASTPATSTPAADDFAMKYLNWRPEVDRPTPAQRWGQRA